jgi:acyl-CoA dehydrogenase
VIDGHKWFTSNGIAADFFIVMCRTEEDPSSPSNGRMTQIIVPRDTPGVTVVRGIEVWGSESDHCEIIYDNVRVPLENQLGESGSGHQAAQERLPAGGRSTIRSTSGNRRSSCERPWPERICLQGRR